MFQNFILQTFKYATYIQFVSLVLQQHGGVSILISALHCHYLWLQDCFKLSPGVDKDPSSLPHRKKTTWKINWNKTESKASVAIRSSIIEDFCKLLVGKPLFNITKRTNLCSRSLSAQVKNWAHITLDWTRQWCYQNIVFKRHHGSAEGPTTVMQINCQLLFFLLPISTFIYFGGRKDLWIPLCGFKVSFQKGWMSWRGGEGRIALSHLKQGISAMNNTNHLVLFCFLSR